MTVVPNWLFAAGICVVAIVLETVCAGRDPATALKALRQPRWALPFPVWVAIGLAYYGACFFALWRLFGAGEAAHPCIVLLAVVMVANALWNYFFFRRKDYRLSFWYQAPYAAVAIAFLWCAAPIDRAVAVAFGIYMLYWPYALAWTYRVWKLNGNRT